MLRAEKERKYACAQKKGDEKRNSMHYLASLHINTACNKLWLIFEIMTVWNLFKKQILKSRSRERLTDATSEHKTSYDKPLVSHYLFHWIIKSLRSRRIVIWIKWFNLHGTPHGEISLFNTRYSRVRRAATTGRQFYNDRVEVSHSQRFKLPRAEHCFPFLSF